MVDRSSSFLYCLDWLNTNYSMQLGDKVILFISRFRETIPNSIPKYMNGGCYLFYKVIKERFPSAVAYYNSDHVVTKVDGKFFDVTGEVKITNHLPVDGKNYTHEELKRWLIK